MAPNSSDWGHSMFSQKKGKVHKPLLPQTSFSTNINNIWVGTFNSYSYSCNKSYRWSRCGKSDKNLRGGSSPNSELCWSICASLKLNSIRLWIWKKLLTHIFCIIKKIDECKDFKLLILRSLGKKKNPVTKGTGYWWPSLCAVALAALDFGDASLRLIIGPIIVIIMK